MNRLIVASNRVADLDKAVQGAMASTVHLADLYRKINWAHDVVTREKKPFMLLMHFSCLEQGMNLARSLGAQKMALNAHFFNLYSLRYKEVKDRMGRTLYLQRRTSIDYFPWVFGKRQWKQRLKSFYGIQKMMHHLAHDEEALERNYWLLRGEWNHLAQEMGWWRYHLAFLRSLFSILFGRFFYLQVVKHDHYHTLAEANRISILPIVPNRGIIVDRNNVVLATNYSAYTLEITPSKIEDLDATIEEIETLVEITPRDKRRFKKLLEESKSIDSLPIRTKLSDEEVARFMAQRFRFPGVDIVLTSGQAPTAVEGASRIAALVQRARGRIGVLAGGGMLGAALHARRSAPDLLRVAYSPDALQDEELDRVTQLPLGHRARRGRGLGCPALLSLRTGDALRTGRALWSLGTYTRLCSEKDSQKK